MRVLSQFVGFATAASCLLQVLAGYVGGWLVGLWTAVVKTGRQAGLYLLSIHECRLNFFSERNNFSIFL